MWAPVWCGAWLPMSPQSPFPISPNPPPPTPPHTAGKRPLTHVRAKPPPRPKPTYPDLLATLTTARNPPQTAFSHPSVIPVKTGITPLKPRTAQTDGYRSQYVLTPTLPNGKFPMLCDSGMEESRHPKIAELRKYMLNRPSKAVMALIVEAFGALVAALTKPFVSHDVGYAQVVPGQKSRKVRNHMLKSPFKSVIARAATFALVLSLGIAFATVGLAPSASAQQADEPSCVANSAGTMITCSYDENGTDPVARLHRDGPRGTGSRVGLGWARRQQIHDRRRRTFLQEGARLRRRPKKLPSDCESHGGVGPGRHRSGPVHRRHDHGDHQ